jgi:hypothetical protein
VKPDLFPHWSQYVCRISPMMHDSRTVKNQDPWWFLPSEHAGGSCSVTSIFRQACDGSTFVRPLTARCQATVGHADLRTTTPLFRDLAEVGHRAGRDRRGGGLVSGGTDRPVASGPAGSAVRLQPDHGQDTTSPVRVVVACRVGPRHRPGGAPFAGVRVIRSAGAAGLARLG